MDNLKPLLITEFIKNERSTLAKCENDLKELPLTYNEKLEKLESILKRGINFGLEKGMFIEQEKNKTIKNAQEKKLNKYVDELVFEINDQIMKARNQPKVKYSKKKYRKRKHPQQLNMWETLGFIADFI